MALPTLPFGIQAIELISGARVAGRAAHLAYEWVRLSWPASAWREKIAELRKLREQANQELSRLEAAGPQKWQPQPGGSSTKGYQAKRNKQLRENHSVQLHAKQGILAQLDTALNSLDYTTR